MKVMNCRQLGGACDVEFRGETFEEMKAQSQAHGKAMFEQNDAEHLEAMNAMRERMQSPGAMEEWMAERERAFDALPEVD